MAVFKMGTKTVLSQTGSDNPILETGTIGNNVTVEGSFGVTDISSSFTYDSDFSSWFTLQAWHFNGFVFVTFGAYRAASGMSGTEEIVLNIANPYRPGTAHYAPTIAYQGDRATYVRFNTDGTVSAFHPTDLGDSNWYIVVNAFYKT